MQTVYLYKEGVFWIAYEQSAYLVSQVKSLKPTKKYVKAVGQEVVSVGFPDTALANLLLSFRVISQNDLQVVAESFQTIEEASFEAWKSDLPLREKSPLNPPKEDFSPLFWKGVGGEAGTELLILKKLQIFSLADKTPMECMFFLSDLQKQLQLYGNVR